MNNKIAMVGDNSVQTSLCKILREKSLDCKILSPEDVKLTKNIFSDYGTVVLPFPSRDNNIAFYRERNCRELFSENQLIVGGMFTEDVRDYFEVDGVRLADYFLDETYVLKNAYLTFQGVLRLLLEYADSYLAGKAALVTGFGRIAKPLCLALKALGMKVYVAVRSDVQTAEAEMLGFDVLKINNIKGTLFYFDYIFNTVPFNIFDEQDIKHLKNSSVYFEIASKPYGAAEEHFDIYGKKYILASALPGKFYPFGVAENISDYLIRKELI